MDHAPQLTAEQQFAVNYVKDHVEAKVARTLALTREMPPGVDMDYIIITTVKLMGDDQDSIVMMLAIQVLAQRVVALEVAARARVVASN